MYLLFLSLLVAPFLNRVYYNSHVMLTLKFCFLIGHIFHNRCSGLLWLNRNLLIGRNPCLLYECSRSHSPAQARYSNPHCWFRKLCYRLLLLNNLCCQCSVTGSRMDLAANSLLLVDRNSSCIRTSVPGPRGGELYRTHFEQTPVFSKTRPSVVNPVFWREKIYRYAVNTLWLLWRIIRLLFYMFLIT